MCEKLPILLGKVKRSHSKSIAYLSRGGGPTWETAAASASGKGASGPSARASRTHCGGAPQTCARPRECTGLGARAAPV
jgi:hypothetical protein